MGFLKFLKRDKKQNFNELDLPPEPPPLDDFDEKIDAPGFDFDAAPEPPMDFEDKEFQDNFNQFPQQFGSDRPIPASTPSTPETPITKPNPAPEDVSEQTLQFARPIHHSQNAPHYAMQSPTSRNILRSGGTIYVKIDSFRSILGGIGTVRSDIRKSDEVLLKMESMRSTKDATFEKLRGSFQDLQKKLIFIDKTLFKG